MAPAGKRSGRPPLLHEFVGGTWVHQSTGEPYNRRTHEALVRERKRVCMRRAYWERGGRQKRLDRYVRKRGPKARQSTLVELERPPACDVERAAAAVPIPCPAPPPA